MAIPGDVIAIRIAVTPALAFISTHIHALDSSAPSCEKYSVS